MTKVVEKIGAAAALEQLAEESSELAQVALKMARKMRGENPTPKTIEDCQNELNEEIADVLVCLSAINGLYDQHAVTLWHRFKQARWDSRLKEGGEHGES